MDGTGVAAGGLVRIELDGNGRLWDVTLDPRVAHLPVEELRTALISAFTEAQDSQRDEAVPAFSPDPERLKAVSTEAAELAEHRFAEISTALYDLTRRAGRTW